MKEWFCFQHVHSYEWMKALLGLVERRKEHMYT